MAEGRPPHGTEPRLSPSAGCLQLPVREIAPSTRTFLARWLDPPTEGVNDQYLQQNWVGLAELINFDNQTIQNLEATKKSPTEALLQAYSVKKDASVGSLWSHLVDLQRYDIVEEPQFVAMLERDLGNHQKREEERERRERDLRAEAENSRPLQVHNVTSGTLEEEEDWSKIDAETDEYDQMVVDDVETGKTTYFDAFVSYCHDDLPFVQEMISMLERVHGLKLCVNARDLLAGGSRHFITARLIADRCRKVILVMSPSFLRSPECEFQVKVALSLSPGAKRKILIPILFKYCKMPLVLQHVCLVDYTKSDLAEWFWCRLAASLKESRRHKRLIPPNDLNSLDTVRYDLDYDYKTSDLPDINTVDVAEARNDTLDYDPNYFGNTPENNDDLFGKNNSSGSEGNTGSLPYQQQETMNVLETSYGRSSSRQQNTTQMTSRQAMTASSCGYPNRSESSLESPNVSRNQLQGRAYNSPSNPDNAQLPLTVTSLFSDHGKDTSCSTERLLPDPNLQSISSADFEVHSRVYSGRSYGNPSFQSSIGTTSLGSRNTRTSLLPDDSDLYKHSSGEYDDFEINDDISLPDDNVQSLGGGSAILSLFPPLPPARNNTRTDSFNTQL